MNHPSADFARGSQAPLFAAVNIFSNEIMPAYIFIGIVLAQAYYCCDSYLARSTYFLSRSSLFIFPHSPPQVPRSPSRHILTHDGYRRHCYQWCC